MRSLVERGLSLKQAAKQFGMSYSAVQARSVLEGWKFHGQGRPRILDYPDGSERVQRARQEAQYDALQEELQREAGVLVIDVKKAELLAQKVLSQHSVRMKVAFSELVVASVESLRRADVKPRDRAVALGALRGVCDRLYGWDKEPDLREMELARTTGAVNLRLIATSPEQLALMAGAKAKRDGNRDDNPDGQCNAQGMGPSALAPEQELTATHGPPSPKKEAPPLPVNQPVQPRRETTVEPPPPLSPQERRRRELEELDRLRAEWRRGR